MKKNVLRKVFSVIILVFILVSCKEEELEKSGWPNFNDYSVVSLIQSSKPDASSLSYNDILEMTKEAVNLAGGLTGIVKTGDTVVLKPNVVSAYYSWGYGGSIPELVNGIATDWRVIQAVAEIVREIIGPSGKIRLMEGPAGGPSSDYFSIVGWTKENLTFVDEIIGLDTEGVWVGAGEGTSADTLIALPDFDYKKADSAKLEWGGNYKYNDYYKNDGKYWVNKKMLEADALICIPVVKTHNAAGGVTGSIKNIGIGAAPPNVYGISETNKGRNAMINHSAMVIHDWISDYYRCLPADFVVMDGLQGLQNGPGGQADLAELQSDQKNLRCILASKDALAIDTVEAYIMNWEIPVYMQNIAKRGFVHARGEIGKEDPRTIQQCADTKYIVVTGNRKVDDVRGNLANNNGSRTDPWAGSLSNGGRKLTAAELAKPKVEITSSSFAGNELLLSLNLSGGKNDAVAKIDVYINGNYTASFNEDMANIKLDIMEIAASEYKVQVFGYTEYLSHDEAEVIISK